jgi:hypothetical protein
MRKTLIAVAAALSILGFGTAGASALTPAPINGSEQVRSGTASAIQKADWYCGPRCEYRRHQQWRERRWEGQRWRDHHYGQNRYGYNRGYGHGYGYGYHYR